MCELLPRHLIMLINVCGLPWIANPNVFNGPRRAVSVLVEHILGELALLWLILVLGLGVSIVLTGNYDECPETYV